jgi:hypothetical protein
MDKGKRGFDAVFTTLDAYLSGYLTLQGFIPRLIYQGEKIVFSFDAPDELYQAISEYNYGATVEASKFAFAIKTLKSQIHSLRKNKGNMYGQIQKKEI